MTAMKRLFVLTAAALAAALLLSVLTAQAQSPDEFEARWFNVASGGGTSSGGEFTLSGSIGQPDAGMLSGGEFDLWGGFQAGFTGGINPGLPMECNGDGTLNAADITAVVLEIFDGDGAAPNDAHMGTFVGTPGCDLNEDQEIGAADITCVVLLIFGRECGIAP